MNETLTLDSVESVQPVSVTEQVFGVLYDRIVELELPPGTRLSEVEVARQMDISRQPVRDAFYRLSQLGFLRVRPQRATVVTPISARSVLEARFIRTAIEIETVRHAAQRIDAAGRQSLQDLIVRQRAAIGEGDKVLFHALDDEFHRTICEIAGAEFAWSLIRDKKAHMDRARYLSLSFGAHDAIEDHVLILEALEAGDEDAAASRMRVHLSRIIDILDQIRSERGDAMVDDTN